MEEEMKSNVTNRYCQITYAIQLANYSRSPTTGVVRSAVSVALYFSLWLILSGGKDERLVMAYVIVLGMHDEAEPLRVDRQIRPALRRYVKHERSKVPSGNEIVTTD